MGLLVPSIPYLSITYPLIITGKKSSEGWQITNSIMQALSLLAEESVKKIHKKTIQAIPLTCSAPRTKRMVQGVGNFMLALRSASFATKKSLGLQ